MKILVTGASGQLGQYIQQFFFQSKNSFELFPFNKKTLDVTNLEMVLNKIEECRPDVIIHGAAFTQVDEAEVKIDKTYQINAIGTRNIAIASEKVGAKLIYISTDYVFNGKKSGAYNEYDVVSPLGVYGLSKKAGEDFVKSFSSRWFIIRTAWLYGAYGTNFVKTMLNLATKDEPLKVVNDQIGSPTYARDLVEFIFQLLQTELYGIYHVSNCGYCSWYEFAQSIFRAAGLNIEVNPCSSNEFPRRAPRPAYSVLDHMAIRINGFQDLRTWQEALQDFISLYRSNRADLS